MGRLVAGAAHDFNNILSVILTCADELLSAATDDDQREWLTEIRAAALRGGDLNRKLIDITREASAGGQAPQPTDVGATIRSATSLLERTLGRRIELELDLDDALPPAFCSSDDLVASLLNVTGNARDAMPAGGTVVLRASSATLDADDPILGPGWYVRIDVHDNGVGMTPRVLRRAPDPFFTTKAERGTGLGLPTVYGTARAAGGDARITSAPGAGTTVTILLPAVGRDGQLLALVGA
jgi:signal transduction histidine kinase